MELGIMALTQLSLNFNPLPETVFLIVRKRSYEEIPFLRSKTSHIPLWGEIQWVNTSREFTDEEVIEGANELLDLMVEEDRIERNLIFYSKQFNGYEVLFTKKMEAIALSDYALEVVKSWEIEKSDGARVIECKLKLL